MPECLSEHRRAAPAGGEILELRLERPDALNAINVTMMKELDEALARLNGDYNVRALVFTGAGRAFCVGADLIERREMSDGQVKKFLTQAGKTFRAIELLHCPTIAAIHGYALGGGLELALACDLRVIHRDAHVGLTETSLGIIPGAGGTQRLARVVGMARALELILTARKIDAMEAEKIGLAHEVGLDQHNAATISRRAFALADEVSHNAPIALAQARIAIRGGIDLSLDDALAFERKCYEATIPTQDRVEALEAFREKRPPKFQGK